MKTVTLGDVSQYIRGITFKPTDVVEAHSENSVVCMRTKNVQEMLDESDLIAVHPNFVKRDEQYLRDGDLLVSSANSWNLVGKTCYIHDLNYKATAGGFISIVRPKLNIIDPRYLYHWLSSNKTQHYARLCGQQTTNISNLNKGRFLKLSLPLPPLEEQKRIAAILDKADRVRRKRQEAIRLTEELGRSIFLDMFGDPVTNPKGWEKVSLSKIVKGDIRNGLSPSNKGNYYGNVLTLAAVTQGFFRSREYKSGMFDIDPPENKKVHCSDFLVCRGNGNISLVGRACFPDQNYEDILFPDTIIGVPVNLSIVNKSFLQTMWDSSLVRRQIEQQACTTNGTYKINQTTLKNIEILLPPFSLQSKFGEAFESISSIKTKFSSQTAENLFNSLLQRAFRGEL
jgi:type I restriction enzyme, S subunit